MKSTAFNLKLKTGVLLIISKNLKKFQIMKNLLKKDILGILMVTLLIFTACNQGNREGTNNLQHIQNPK
jgi:hypothetical protein